MHNRHCRAKQPGSSEKQSPGSKASSSIQKQQKKLLARANSRFSDPTIEQQEDHTGTFIRMFSLLMFDASPMPFI